jgi:alpha-maltose-1-phosphate synthase
MTNVLSIQSDVLGNKTYGRVLRESFSEIGSVSLDSFWFHENRSISNRIIRKIAGFRVPLLNDQNRDFRRTRVEWANGRMSRSLAEQKLDQKHYDLLHFHTQVQALGSSGLMRKIPTVITIDMTMHQVASEVMAPPTWTFSPSIKREKQVFAAAAHIVTFSEWAKNSVVEDHGISQGKVTVIHPGVLIERIEAPSFEKKEKPRILFVGNDLRRKGGHDLLEVFVAKFAEEAELHLMTNEAFEFNHPSVFWHRGIAAYTEEWHRIFREADIFVMPSYKEAYGHVFQEAAAFGLALVGSKVGGIPEMVADGSNGFLVAPGDKRALSSALQLFVTDEILLQRMRRQSRKLALEKFDARRNFSSLADLFKRVAKK